MKKPSRRHRLSRLFPGFAYLKLEFRRVWRAEPGARFHSRYRRVRRRKGYDELAPRMVRLMFAVTSLAAGFICILLPFPEVPFFILSGALFASESSALARMMDRLELRIHAWMRACRAKWRESPIIVKGLVAVLLFAALVGRCYLMCRPFLK